MWPAIGGELNVKFIEQRFLTPQKLKGEIFFFSFNLMESEVNF